MLYDRRHTHEISEFGGLATPMPVLMSFFLFISLSSLALPPLNGFIGEFLILIGVFEHHHQWASWAASGAVLSAIYLLGAYQRVARGELTVDKNRALPDANTRERVILVAMAVMIIFMGVVVGFVAVALISAMSFSLRIRGGVSAMVSPVILNSTPSSSNAFSIAA